MADEERDWFTMKADIQIAEPVIDEETGEYRGGALATKALSQEMLKELFEGEGHFMVRVDAYRDELWLRVCRSDAKEPDAPDEDLVFINLGFRSAERLRDALDVALKMREPRAREVLPLR
jgi:hypothetical protein